MFAKDEVKIKQSVEQMDLKVREMVGVQDRSPSQEALTSAESQSRQSTL